MRSSITTQCASHQARNNLPPKDNLALLGLDLIDAGDVDHLWGGSRDCAHEIVSHRTCDLDRNDLPDGKLAFDDHQAVDFRRIAIGSTNAQTFIIAFN